MSSEASTARPFPWLTLALAATCAVLGFRLAAAILTLAHPWPPGLAIGDVASESEPRGLLFDLIGTAAAVLVTLGVTRLFWSKSPRAKAVALVIVAILAVVPYRVRVVVHVPPLPPAAPRGAQVKPVSLAVKLLDGEMIRPDVIIDESDVEQAYATQDPSGTYAVALNLDARGRSAITQTTETQIGKRLAIFLNGELVCSPKIEARIASPVIQIPGHFNQPDAKETAAGIEAARKKAPTGG